MRIFYIDNFWLSYLDIFIPYIHMIDFKDFNSVLRYITFKSQNVITVVLSYLIFFFLRMCLKYTQEQSETYCTHFISLRICCPPSNCLSFRVVWLERVRRIRTKDRRVVSSLCVICQKHSLAEFVPLCRDEYMRAAWYASRIRLNECQTGG